MKKFFNVKRTIYLAIVCATLLTLILMFIFPIGLYPSSVDYVKVYSTYFKMTQDHPVGKRMFEFDVLSPFTVRNIFLTEWAQVKYPDILLAQTITFPIVGIIFVVFFVLFMVELKKAGAFKRTHRPTKTERLQAQIDELQKQIDELKQENK